MKLHSPRFEKVLRRKVKKAVWSSPALKKEYRQANRAVRRHRRIGWLVWPVLAFGVGCAVRAIVAVTGHPATGLAVINLAILLLAAQSAQRLLMFLFRATDLPALSLLPLRESAVFRWELQKFFRQSAVFSLVAMLAMYGGLGTKLGLSIPQWVATVVVAVLSWLTLLALGAFLAARFPALPYPIFTGAAYAFAFTLFAAWKTIGSAVLDFIDHVAPTMNTFLPTGWCPTLFQCVVLEKQWTFVFLILPIVVIIYTLKRSLKLLENKLKFAEYVRPEIQDDIPGEDPNTLEQSQGPVHASRARLGPTAIEEIVQTRRIFLQEPWERRGRVERALWQWFSPRQRTLAEFAFPRGISITKPWILFLRNFSVLILIGFVVGMADMTLEFWVIGVGLFLTTVHALALAWGNGASFRVVPSSGVNMHLYAAYPINFRELSNMLFKVSLIQLPFFVAYAMVCSVVICYLTVTPFGGGLIAAVKLGFLIFSARFITTTLAFSGCTNDTARLRPWTIVLILAFTGSAVSFLGLSAGSLFARGPIAWGLWVGAMADAYAIFRIYGWFYSTNKFDLMSVPRR